MAKSMTIKELFKKVAAYNEISEIMNGRQVAVSFWDDIYQHTFNSFKEFKDFLDETYIESAATEILSAKFTDSVETTIKYVDRIFGEETLRLEVAVVTVW